MSISKYIQEARDGMSKGYPKTYEEFLKLNHSESRRVPQHHVEALRNTFMQEKTRMKKLGDTEIPNISSRINWDEVDSHRASLKKNRK